MTPTDPGHCAACGKGGVLYLWEERSYCPDCLSKQKPPLSYPGPERRSGKKVSIFRRRTEENRPRSRKP